MVHLRVPVPINYFFTRNFNSTEKTCLILYSNYNISKPVAIAKKKKKPLPRAPPQSRFLDFLIKFLPVLREAS